MSAAQKSTTDQPVILFADPQAWDRWLDEHQAESAGVWLRLAKKGAEITSISYAEALDVALCYGWIDSQKKSHDEASWLQKFTPRGAKSIWSKINRDKVEALISNGQMKPAGLAAIEQAQQDGRWDAAYDSARNATVPNDFQAALDENPRAKAFFNTLKRGNRYAILFRLQTAKKAETRLKRIQQFITMLENHETVHP